jgi:hypothetical protein
MLHLGASLAVGLTANQIFLAIIAGRADKTFL